MSTNLAYIYAEIIPETGECIGVITTTINHDDNPEYVPIPAYNEDYIWKYYINGAWYENEEGTIPWSPEE